MMRGFYEIFCQTYCVQCSLHFGRELGTPGEVPGELLCEACVKKVERSRDLRSPDRPGMLPATIEDFRK